MANLLDIEYYEDPTKWGKSNFVSLESIVQNIMLTADDDSYFKHINRFSALIHGKQLLKDLDLGFMSRDMAISVQVSPTRIFPFPKYMTAWTRISHLKIENNCRKLYTLNIDPRPGIQDYLQDHDHELLYDDQGKVLEGNGIDVSIGGCKNIICGIETSEDFDYTESWVRPVKVGGYFKFSENLVDEPIVIEYTLSGLDGLDACDINIPNALEKTVTNGIKWKLTEGKRNVRLSEPTYWYQQHKRAKEKARDILADKITIQEILRSVSLRYNN